MTPPIAIHQRRYIGSKTKLLSFIDGILKDEGASYNSVADIFAGTGVVGSYFNQRASVILNDTLESNYLAHQAFLGPEAINQPVLNDRIAYYNGLSLDELGDNYVSKHFADTYFSHANCKRIGFIREDIEAFSKAAGLNERERAYLITSLLYAMDRIANTVGHYDAYRKTGDTSRKLELRNLLVSGHNHNNKIYRSDANQLVHSLASDIVYIDPPYNSRQYSDSYHLLENIASWQKPPVLGVAKKMDRKHLKSKYSLKSASSAFSDLIDNIGPSTKYILVSYNDMGANGDQRSQSRILDHELKSALERRGTLKIFERDFRQFTTGKSTNGDLKERIFFCKVTPKLHNNASSKSVSKVEPVSQFVKSPLNYTGGKYRLLPQLIEYFPPNIQTFYDVFCGGANVGINAKAQKIICLDNSLQLINLLEYIQDTNFESLHQSIMLIIAKYKLSQSYTNGYAHYGVESSGGLGQYNKPNFMKLREAYNDPATETNKNLLLLVLILYGFNNQIRFNSAGKFNLPVGKRDYNGSSRKNLARFNEVINRKAVNFKLGDFRNLSKMKFQKDDFVYLDPPYLLGLASYNENGGWSEKDEEDLHKVLTKLDKRGVRFGLSNVLEHKGETNAILSEWAAGNGFNINRLDFQYGNASYQSKAKHFQTQEVLITNYTL